jgi:pyruvate/2-oxoglutarate dehydrogenase complex dihydrolipoamide acyltransferase (E2) component
MFRGRIAPSLGFHVACVSAAILLSAVPGGPLSAQAPGSTTAGSQEPSEHHARTAPNARVFASDAGMVLNFVKPDKTADFEAIVAKVREALQKSDKQERKQQAAGWKVFRALEPGANGSVLYVFEIDPAVKGADYTVSNILAEAFPKDVQALYKQYAEAYSTGQNFVNLTLVSSLGQ